MKKLDKLILSSFIGPFILTFLVVVFILLNTQMLKYYDDIIGKDVGFLVLVNLMFDFSIFMAPTAFPLAVLLSSLMTFGNLGEHFELTAIKSAGISLLRVIVPIFIFVIGLTVFAFYFNNYFVPKAALNAYSLLYDIKQKKPALDLKEGAFYNGIPDLSIKVERKDSETGEIWDVIIYDHRDKIGNKKVTLADSGKMYTVFNDQYLILELYSGHSYLEGRSNAQSVSSKNVSSKAESLSRIKFDKSKIVLDLSSFDLKHTKKELFSGDRMMRNLVQLGYDMDSLRQDALEHKLTAHTNTRNSFKYLTKDRLSLSKELVQLEMLKDSLLKIKDTDRKEELINLKPEEPDKISANAVSRERMIEAPARGVTSNIQKIDSGKFRNSSNNTDSTLVAINKTKRKERKITDVKKPLTTRPTDDEVAIANMSKERAKKLQTINADQKSKSINKNGSKKNVINYEERIEKLNAFIVKKEVDKKALKATINRVRQVKSKIQNSTVRMEKIALGRYVFEVQWHKIISNSCACLVMFLIGAPLGAIIKKGGLGSPVLISIFFFIVFYVFGMIGEKQAKAGLIDPLLGVWAANITLLPVGLFFLRQARNDARLFDADFYNVVLDKIKSKFKKKD